MELKQYLYFLYRRKNAAAYFHTAASSIIILGNHCGQE